MSIYPILAPMIFKKISIISKIPLFVKYWRVSIEITKIIIITKAEINLILKYLRKIPRGIKIKILPIKLINTTLLVKISFIHLVIYVPSL